MILLRFFNFCRLEMKAPDFSGNFGLNYLKIRLLPRNNSPQKVGRP
jgi:hypothetical protein